jgi:hypothetical protein
VYTHWYINLAALRDWQSLLVAKCFSLQLMQRGVVCSQGLPIVLQLEQEWSLDRCAAAQNRQALVEHLSPIWPNFWQLVHCVVGETFRYLTTLVATPAIRISFCLRISCLFSLFSTANTIEPNLVCGSYLFALEEIHLGSPCILIELKVSISSFRSLEPPSPRKGGIGTP